MGKGGVGRPTHTKYCDIQGRLLVLDLIYGEWEPEKLQARMETEVGAALGHHIVLYCIPKLASEKALPSANAAHSDQIAITEAS